MLFKATHICETEDRSWCGRLIGKLPCFGRHRLELAAWAPLFVVRSPPPTIPCQGSRNATEKPARIGVAHERGVSYAVQLSPPSRGRQYPLRCLPRPPVVIQAFRGPWVAMQVPLEEKEASPAKARWLYFRHDRVPGGATVSGANVGETLLRWAPNRAVRDATLRSPEREAIIEGVHRFVLKLNAPVRTGVFPSCRCENLRCFPR